MGGAGPGKFCCSIGGEEVEVEGKKTRLREKTSTGSRLVILVRCPADV